MNAPTALIARTAQLYLPGLDAAVPITVFQNTLTVAALLLGLPDAQVEILAGNDGSGYTAYAPTWDGVEHEHNLVGESALELLVQDFCDVSGPLLIIID